jgi:hypothetical protein
MPRAFNLAIPGYISRLVYTQALADMASNPAMASSQSP